MDMLSYVKYRVKALEKSQLEEAAAKSGVPYHTLLKIWNGATGDPRASTMQKLYSYFEHKAA